LKIIGYIWRVITNLFYLAVVMYALGELHGRKETLIVSTLGLIYVTIRTIAWGQFIATLGVTAGCRCSWTLFRLGLMAPSTQCPQKT
jgi:hypothetical protein